MEGFHFRLLIERGNNERGDGRVFCPEGPDGEARNFRKAKKALFRNPPDPNFFEAFPPQRADISLPPKKIEAISTPPKGRSVLLLLQNPPDPNFFEAFLPQRADISLPSIERTVSLASPRI